MIIVQGREWLRPFVEWENTKWSRYLGILKAWTVVAAKRLERRPSMIKFVSLITFFLRRAFEDRFSFSQIVMQWRFLFLCLGHDVPWEIRKNIFVAAEDELLSNQRPRTYFLSRCTAERLDKQRRQYHYIIAVVISKLQISSQNTLSHCISPLYKKKLC